MPDEELLVEEEEVLVLDEEDELLELEELELLEAELLEDELEEELELLDELLEPEPEDPPQADSSIKQRIERMTAGIDLVADGNIRLPDMVGFRLFEGRLYHDTKFFHHLSAYANMLSIFCLKSGFIYLCTNCMTYAS